MSDFEAPTPPGSPVPSPERAHTPAPPVSRWDEIPPGSIFAGKYRIERLLARGGMSGVYLATQLPINRSVALKILVPLVEDADGEASFQERFRLEARTLASLNHPNIVVLYDYGETEDGRFFLAMEFVDGPRLSDVLKEAGRMPLPRAVRVALQCCAALRYAHNRGVVHRDIKLSNIMLWSDHDHNEQVKVVDFGLVKLTETDQRLTSAGMVLGSPHFIAPEQARGQHVDHRADIYAIGVTLFCMLTGKPPFSGATATATILAHLTQPIPSLQSVAPDLDVPPGIEAVIHRCLEKRAEDRYPDMNHLVADLVALSDGSIPGTLRADGPSNNSMMTLATAQVPDPPQAGKQKMVMAALIAAVAVLVIAGVVLVGVLSFLRLGAQPAPTPEAATAPAPATASPEPAATTPAATTPAPAATTAEPAATPPPPEATPAPRAARARAPKTAEPAASAAPAPTPPPSQAEPAPKKDAQTGDGWKTSDLKNPWDD